MSQVYAIPGAMTAGLIAATIAAEFTSSGPTVGAVGFGVAIVVGVVWVTSDRFPDGSGPL